MKSVDRPRRTLLLGMFVYFVALIPINHVASQSCIQLPSGLISWWSLDGNASDIGPFERYDGTILGTVTFVPGKVGLGALFDSNDDRITVQLTPPQPPLPFTEAFTIEGWAASDASPQDYVSLSSDEFVLGLGGFGICCAKVTRGGAGGSPYFLCDAVPVGTFNHFALTYNSLTKLLKLYINGLKRVETNVGSDDPVFFARLKQADIQFVEVNIGGIGYLGQHGASIGTATLDEWSIYNVELTEDQVHDIFLTGSAGKCKFNTVEIDIEPGSDPNSINCNNDNGIIPVAILSTDDFDATTVDHATVRFGKTGTEAEEIHKKNGAPKRHEEDVDGDGDTDLVFHFRFGDTGVECGDEEAILTGETFDDQDIEGSDAIRTVEGGANKSVAFQNEVGLPESYALSQNHPNPFNPDTEIRFQLPEAGHVVVKIFNIVGEEIRTLVEAEYEAGYHHVRWDGKDKNGHPVASGVYLYQLRVGNFSQVKKMSLLR